MQRSEKWDRLKKHTRLIKTYTKRLQQAIVIWVKTAMLMEMDSNVRFIVDGWISSVCLEEMLLQSVSESPDRQTA